MNFGCDLKIDYCHHAPPLLLFSLLFLWSFMLVCCSLMSGCGAVPKDSNATAIVPQAFKNPSPRVGNDPAAKMRGDP